MKEILFSLLFASTVAFTSLCADQAAISEAKTVTFLLPMNRTSPKHVNLMVKIPENFTAIQPADTWADSTIIEFIPNGQDENNWQQIITINKFLGTKISATDLTTHLKAFMIDQSTGGSVLKLESKTDAGYNTAALGLAYDYKDKHEVVGTVYYSGPEDCVGVQYTIRPEKGISDQEAFSKIESYFKENTQVITD